MLTLVINGEGGQVDYQRIGFEKVEEVDKEEVQEKINELNAKLKRLKAKEDDFDRNAALVPESDPNLNLINNRIIEIKEQVEKLSAERA